jgi:hypothetical protein
MNKTLLTLGLLITLLTIALLLFGIIPLWMAIAVGALGIGLISFSIRWEQATPASAPGAQVVQTIHSADGQLRAVIKQRTDGKYQVEIQSFVREDSQDFGQNDRWVRQSAPITDTLSSAVEIATGYVRTEEDSAG